MLNLTMTEIEVWDIGHGDLYRGKQYDRPWFFDTPNMKMMRDMGGDTIDFKTWKGEYFQFFLDSYHGNTALFLTSTLQDCCIFTSSCLSLSKMRAWCQKHSEKKTKVEGSFTGYFSFGKKLLEQYDLLDKHIEEQEIYFTDETIERAFNELKRRSKECH